MNLEQLDKIIKQIKRYGLLGETFDIRDWVISLNNKQTNNFLSLDIELKDNLKNNRSVLMNRALLNSDNYIYDLELINDSDQKTAEYVVALINKNPNHITKDYHRRDIEIIKSVKDEMVKLRLLNLALFDDRSDIDHSERMNNVYITTKEGNNLNELNMLRNQFANYVDKDEAKDVDLKKVSKWKIML